MIKIKRLGHVVLRVRNLDKSAHFYRDILGLKEVTRYQDAMVFFSIDNMNHHDLAIMAVPNASGSSPNSVGLYHIAFKIGDDIEELKQARQWLVKNKVAISGSADHTVSKSLYIADPDGNEIELYIDSKGWQEHRQEITVKPLRI